MARQAKRRGHSLGAVLGVTVFSLVGAGCGGGTHTVVTSTSASAALASELDGAVPSWIKAEKLPAAAAPGAKLFARAGCTACHTYLGSGASNLDAPDLTGIGARHLGINFQIRHLECPACVNQGSPMPKFAVLGRKRLHALAVFLEASKGRR